MLCKATSLRGLTTELWSFLLTFYFDALYRLRLGENTGMSAMHDWISLNDNKDFVRLYKRGRSVVTPVFVLYFNKNNLTYNRIGITTSKKIGNAVKRNRARRVINAAIINCKSILPRGYDFVFVARVRSTKEKSTVIEKYLRTTIERQFKDRRG